LFDIVPFSFSFREYLPNAPSIDTIHANFSGYLINTHDVWEYPRAYPRNSVRVLGMHISKEMKLLPQVRYASHKDI
jgi:hypothetical protein